MVYIDCPIQQDFVIKTLVELQQEICFTYVGKSGIRLSFSVNTQELDEAIAVAKKAIKATDIGKVLYLQFTK